MTDLISRQAAKEHFYMYVPGLAWDKIDAILDDVPSAQTITPCYLDGPCEYQNKDIKLPSTQPEIIRCKDCKHRDQEDKKCDCGHDIMWQLPRDDNWYCADAERRADE